MVIQVTSGSKPAVRSRTLLAVPLLLLFTCILAASLTWSRAANGMRIHSENWLISIQVPPPFVQTADSKTRFGTAVYFEEMSGKPDPATLAVLQTKPLDVRSNEALCRLFAAAEPPTNKDGRPQLRAPIPYDAVAVPMLGPWEAAECADPTYGLVVRSVLLDYGGGLVVWLESPGGIPVSSQLYDQFDESCRSIQEIRP